MGKFKNFLVYKKIPFEEDTDGGVWVSNDDLIDWEDELLLEFPEFSFGEEPNQTSDEPN